ncbi:MAG: type III polyketide synthase [Gammaproteobacteria bacterium]
MKTAITAIGIANPKFKRSQMETAELLIASLHLRPVEKRLLKSVYRATGIEQRHSVLSDYCRAPGEFEFFPNDPEAAFPSTSARMKIYKENALHLSIDAIEKCFVTPNGTKKSEITHLITVSCTGMYAPGIDIEIVQALNLSSNLKRTAINFMGCYGAFNGMKVADAICRADPEAKILVVCVELCTIHFQKDPSITNMISNAIFADGAAAIIIEAKSDNKKCLSIESFYCDLLPQTSKEMAWHIADHGFDIVLSTYVPEVIETGIHAFASKLLQQSGMSLSEIDFYAIHPGGLKILQACEAALNITEEDNRYSYDVLRNYGNMSSPTVLFVLKKIWDSLTTQDHQKNIFSCAFGPGLTLESMILTTHCAA